MNQELKRSIILEHKANPTNFVSDFNDDTYIKINANNISCIDEFELYLKINNDIISDIKFVGEGCVISIASTSIMINLLLNKTIKEAIYIINEFNNMINELPYDEVILEEANVFNEVYKQANRKKCATISWTSLKEYLEAI